MDPNERVPGRERWIREADDFPDELPSGVTRDPKVWYGFEYVTRDGRKFVQWFKRGSGPVVDGKPQDPVFTEQQAGIVPSIQEKFEKEQKEAEAKEDKAPPTRNINGVPHERTKQPDGEYAWTPVPTASGPATAAPSQTQAAAPGGKPFEDDGPDAGAAGRRWGWNPETRLYDRDLGPSPSAQGLGTKPATAAAKPVRSYTGVDPKTNKPATVTEMSDGSLTYEEIKPGAAGARKPIRSYTGVDPQTNRPATVTEYDTGDKTYEEVKPEAAKPKYSRTEFDKDSGKWYGLTPDGKWEEMQGGPGATTGANGQGPSMPAIMADQQSETLTAYHNTLRADPTLTPAQRERRFAEAVQVATFAQAEARRQQDERQSNRGAHVNVATARLSYMQAGMAQALSFVDSINGKLPPGSDLGAKAFVAMLNLQMIRAKDSGIYDLYPPGTRGDWTGVEADRQRKPDPGPPRLANPNNPEAVEQQRQESHRQVQAIFTPQPVAPPPSGAPQPDAVPVGAPVRPTSPAAAPAPTPAARPVAPAAAGVPPAPVTPAPAPAPPVMPPAWVPSAGGAYAPQMAGPGTGATGDGTIVNAPPAGPPDAGAPMPPGAVDMPGDPGAGYNPSNASQTGPWDPYTGLPRVQQMAPDFAALAAYTAPAPNPSAGGMTMPQQPPNEMEFAALQGYQQPPAVQMPEQEPLAMMGTPPAMLHSIAASTPPWQLDDSTIQQMIDAGISEETIFSVPGRTFA